MESSDQSQSTASPESAILAELSASAPVAAADLKKRVFSKVTGLKPKRYNAVLDALIASRKIHGRSKIGGKGKPMKSIASYALGAPPPPPPPPRELAPQAILEALKTGGLAPTALQAKVKTSVPELTAKDLKDVLAELVAARTIYARRKRDKNGKPTTTIERYVLGGPEPDEFLSPVLTAWKAQCSEALAAGITEDQMLAALVTLLPSKQVAPVEAGRAHGPDVIEDGDAVLRGLRELVARDGAGALIPVRRLRAELRLAKEQFDAAVLQLYARDAIILHHHDYVGSLSTAERDALVIDKHGNHYVGVALRGGI